MRVRRMGAAHLCSSPTNSPIYPLTLWKTAEERAANATRHGISHPGGWRWQPGWQARGSYRPWHWDRCPTAVIGAVC